MLIKYIMKKMKSSIAMSTCAFVLVGSAPLYAGNSVLSPGYDQDEVFVLWGGIGYLNKKHQPVMSYLIDGKESMRGVARVKGCWQKEKMQAGSGKCLPELGEESREMARVLQLNGSDHPVIVDDFDKILAQKSMTVEDQLMKKRTNLVFSIVSSFEYFVQVPKTVYVGENVDQEKTYYSGYFFTGLTGMITVAGEGDIVLSYPILVTRTFEDVKPICDSKGKCNMDVIRREYGHAFSQGVEAVMKAMPGAVAKLKMDRKAGLDTDMVTLSYAYAKIARELFHVPDIDIGFNTDICDVKIINPCDRVIKEGGSTEDQHVCQTLTGIVAQGVSEGLAAKGRHVIPPLAWQSWADSALFRMKDNVGMLKLNTAGANKEIKDHIQVRMSAENASRWIVAKFIGVVQDNLPTPSGVLGNRVFRAYLDVQAKDGSSCNEPSDLVNVASIQKAPPISQMVTAAQLGQSVPEDLKRGLWILSTLNALHDFKEGK